MTTILSMIAALLMSSSVRMTSTQESNLRRAETTNDEASAKIIYDELVNNVR